VKTRYPALHYSRILNNPVLTPDPETEAKDKPNLSSAAAYETRTDLEVTPHIATYRTYGLGIDLAPVAWPKLEQVFTGGDTVGQTHFDRPKCIGISNVNRLPTNFLSQDPVDLLVLGNLDTLTYDA
jgi:hypothetical protein